jgi:hypothetical protein
MSPFRQFSRYPLCIVGMHLAPPMRFPHGPVVADCPCCGRTCYFYGLSIYGIGYPPTLSPAFIRPLAQLAH